MERIASGNATILHVNNVVCTLSAALIIRHRRRRQHSERKYWIHPILTNRSTSGKFARLHNNLKEYPDKFFEHYRMSVNSFEVLLSEVEDAISKRNTRLRESICAEERLAVTLRYLGFGTTFRSLHFEFLLGRSTISGIVRETCQAIWEAMKGDYLKPPSTEDWLEISNLFERKANFPHCVGSIDGKHIRVIKPWNSGSEYFNYKKFFSVVLMAVVDSNYCFRLIDVGALGHEGDSNILKATELGKKIYDGTLNLPQPTSLASEPSGKQLPYVFVADEAFAVCENLLRPFPAKQLTPKMQIFNYRLCRARRYVECAFGILANKWRIFHRPLDVSIDLVDIIIKACCVLHNFVRQKDGFNFDDSLSCALENIPAYGTKGSNSGKTTRDNFADYFSSPGGSVPWQSHYITKLN